MHILLASKEGCRWNNFMDVGGTISLTNGMHRLYQKAATKLRKHTQIKVENKMPFQGTFLDNCIEDAMTSLHYQLA